MIRNPKFFRDNENEKKVDLPTTKRRDESPVDIKLASLLKNLRFDEHGPGDMGSGVSIPKEKEDEMREKFKINQFNLMASDMVSINRSLPDYRTSRCRDRGAQIDPATLPKTSIIIVFHNEAWSTLLRTLHSVVNRSPLNAIEEIILVDDCSAPEKGVFPTHVPQTFLYLDYLKAPLEQYVKRFPVPIHLIQLAERSGLIRARLKGSDVAKGKVLLFLDAHVEVTEGWLEPMLQRVAEDRKVVVAPIIDVISDENFEYVTASGKIVWHKITRYTYNSANDRRSKVTRKG